MYCASPPATEELEDCRTSPRLRWHSRAVHNSPKLCSMRLDTLTINRVLLELFVRSFFLYFSFCVSLSLSLFLSLFIFTLTHSLTHSLTYSLSLSVFVCLCVCVSVCLCVCVSVCLCVCVSVCCVLLWCSSSPCVRSQRPRVYQHHARTCFIHVRVVQAYTGTL